jgi:hypothetical protein
MSSLRRTIARQESCIAWIKEGDAPTNLFHMHANGCRRKKFIRSLQHDGQTLVDEGQKDKALFNFFNDVLGTPSQRHKLINLDLLDLPQINLSELAAGFIEEEVLSVIRSLPPDKAPRPDGLMACFFQVVWDTIKTRVILAFDAFWHLTPENSMPLMRPSRCCCLRPRMQRPLGTTALSYSFTSWGSCSQRCSQTALHPA